MAVNFPLCAFQIDIEIICKKNVDSENLPFKPKYLKNSVKMPPSPAVFFLFISYNLFAAVFKFMMNCVDQQSDFLVFRTFSTQHLLSERFQALQLHFAKSVLCGAFLFF